MHLILNRAQIRSYDRLATERCKIPGLLLMENAGRGAAEIIARLSGTKAAKIMVVCGTGNNGGDGFVAARHLTAAGYKNIEICLTGEVKNIPGDAGVNFTAAAASGIVCAPVNIENLASAEIIVDAIFGTGLSRPIADAMAKIITAINESPAKRIALDIPSGLDADTGAVLGLAVQADHTITFAHPKPGLFTPQGKNLCGVIHCVSLGVPEGEILKQTGVAARLIRSEDLEPLMIRRDAATHKHRAGDILVIAGSRGKTGAAKLSAEAALRTGAGLVTVATWSEALPAFEKEVKEVMLAEIQTTGIETCLNKAMAKRSALVLGPGFGLDDPAKRAVHFVLENAMVPVVVDADAITLCAEDMSLLQNPGVTKILTPHAGELARLLQCTSSAIEADRFAAVRRAAETLQSIVILKGAHTLVANPTGEIWVSAEANPVLATAGSGDVLAGIIAAFAAALPPLEAALAGVFVHAAAGKTWSERMHTDRGMIAGDIAALVPEVLGRYFIRRP